MKRIILISLLSAFLCACIVTKSEPSFFGQVTYIEKTSWLTRKAYRFDPDDTERIPFRTSRKVVVIKDSITELTYAWKEGRIKRHKEHGRFNLVKVTSDTAKINVKNNSLVYSDFHLIGAFLPTKNAIPVSNHSEKGIVFYEDGSCIHSWTTTGNESGSSFEYQRLGEYKVFHDTIYTVYFLGRNYSSQIKRSINYPVQSIDEVFWRVIEPYTINCVLSDENDTLRKFYDSREKAFESFLFATDTTKLIPIKSHQE